MVGDDTSGIETSSPLPLAIHLEPYSDDRDDFLDDEDDEEDDLDLAVNTKVEALF